MFKSKSPFNFFSHLFVFFKKILGLECFVSLVYYIIKINNSDFAQFFEDERKYQF